MKEKKGAKNAPFGMRISPLIRRWNAHLFLIRQFFRLLFIWCVILGRGVFSIRASWSLLRPRNVIDTPAFQLTSINKQVDVMCDGAVVLLNQGRPNRHDIAQVVESISSRVSKDRTNTNTIYYGMCGTLRL